MRTMQNQLNKKVSMALHMVVTIVQESVFRMAKVIAEKESTFLRKSSFAIQTNNEGSSEIAISNSPILIKFVGPP